AFPLGSSGKWRCFPVRELDETNDKKLWASAKSGLPLWKGESFDQYDPHGAEARTCPESEEVVKKVLKSKPGQGSILAEEIDVRDRRKAVAEQRSGARIAFRD